MANANNNINVFLQVVDKLTAPLKNAAAQVSVSTAKMNTAFTSVSNTFSKVNTAIAAISAVLAGGAAFKSAIDHTINYRLEVDKLSKTLGISLLQATGFKEALDDLGLSTDVLNTASRMLGMKVAQSGKSLQDYTNILTSNTNVINNNGDAIMSIIEKAQALGDTQARNTLLQTAFGRSYQDALPLLRLTRDELLKVTEQVKGNEEVTKQQVNQIYAFKKAQESGNDTLDAFKRALGDQLLPIIADFANNLGSSKETAKELGTAIGQLVKVLYAAVVGTILFLDIIKIQIIYFKIYASAIRFVYHMFEALALFISRDFKKSSEVATAAIKEHVESLKTSAKDGLAITKHFYTSSIDAAKRLSKVLSNDTPEFKAPENTKPLPVTDTESKKNAEAQTLIIEAAIEKQKSLYVGKTTLLRTELEKEYQLQLENLKKVRLTDDDKNKLAAKLNKELGDLKREGIQEQLQLDQMAAKQTLETVKQSSSLQLAKYQTDLDQQKITLEQFLTKKKELLAIDAAAEGVYYAKLKEMAEGNAIAKQQIANDEAAFKAELALKDEELKKQQAAKEAERLKELQTMLVTAFQQSFEGMLSGAMTFSEAIGNIWQSIGNIVNKIIFQMVEDWIKGEAIKVVAGIKTSILTSAAAVKAAAIATTAKSAETTTSVSNDAVKGTAAAIAAFASKNPLAAIAIGAVIGAAIYSLLGNVKSAKGGWDYVPQDGAMAQLHKGEMVLPAALAEGIRNIVSGGQTGSSTGQVTYNIHAMDASSFDSYLKQNASSVFAANKLAIRNGSQFA